MLENLENEINNCISSPDNIVGKIQPALEIQVKHNNIKTKNCIINQFNNIYRNAILQENLENPDSCKLLAQNNYIIEKTIADKIQTIIDGFISKSSDSIKYQFKITQLKNALAKIDTKSALINCSTNTNEYECYEKQISQLIEPLESFRTQIPIFYEELIQKFKLQNSIVLTKLQINETYEQLFTPFFPEFKEYVKTKWEFCSKNFNNNNSEMPILKPFSGSNAFIHPNILNCINLEYENEVTILINKLFEKIKIEITSENLINYLKKQFVYNIIDQEFNKIILSESKDEENKMIDLQKTILTKLENVIDTTNSWFTFPFSPTSAPGECSEFSLNFIKNEIEKDTALLWKFHEKTNLQTLNTTDICTKAVSDAQAAIKTEGLKLELIKFSTIQSSYVDMYKSGFTKFQNRSECIDKAKPFFEKNITEQALKRQISWKTKSKDEIIRIWSNQMCTDRAISQTDGTFKFN